MKNISGRDIKIFIFGIIAMFIIESVVSWSETKKAFLEGWNDGYNSSTKTETKK